MPAQAAFERGEDRVVVLRESLVHGALEKYAHHGVERFVLLDERDARAAVTEVGEPGPAGRTRPERLPDCVIAPRLVRLDLGQPLPRLADPARQQPLRHREVAVADQAVSVLVTGM